MSTQPVKTVAPNPVQSPEQGLSSEARHRLFPMRRSWKIATAVAIVMILLAHLGVALTTTNSSFAENYWVSLVPIYGLLCIGTAALRDRAGMHFGRQEILQQFFHWLGIGVALGLDFSIRSAGQESAMAAGLNALLLLALGCYLAGVHLEWPFVVVGVILSLMVLIIAKADQYLWLTFVVGVIGIAGLVALWWWGTGHHRESAVAPSPSVPAGS